MVLPKYQRKGLGKWLTRHCNDIADQYRCVTYVRAKPAAAKMLQFSGFEVLGVFDPHMERFGWSRDDSEDQKTTVLSREPKGDVAPSNELL
jgi:GNAT superfamily N-acetyltransferase